MLKIALAIVIGVALLLPQADSVFAEQSIDTDHFTIVYHLSGPNKLDPTGSDAPGFTMPDGTVCNDWPSRPDFINKLACWLEYSFVTWEADGFKMPTVRIWVGVRAQDLSGFVPSRLEMFIKRNISINAIPNLIPHELFHNVQLQYWDIHHPHLWFREPMAQAMAASMVPEPCAGTFDCNPESFKIHANGTPWTHDLFHFPRAAWVDSYDSPSRPTRRGWSTS